jgi:hypothetical protein
MANRSDYTITTLSESVQQRDFAAGVNGTQAPFRFGGPLGPANLRGRKTAYVSAEGNPVAPQPPAPPDTISLSKISASTTAYSPTVENDGFLVNLDKISVGTTAYSITADNAVNYIEPFIYADFETSSSTTVTVTGSQSTYSGTLDTTSNSARPNGEPKYDSTNPFSGSYSMNFYKTPTGNEKFGFVNFGTPADRTEWQTWASGSFSVSVWIYPTDTRNNWTYDGIFWLKNPNASAYSWMLTLNSNSLQWFSTGTTWRDFNSSSVPIVQNQWNHVVYSISSSGGTRSITGYINGHNIGTHGTNFTNDLDTSHTIGLGNWFEGGSFENRGKMDELSCWNFALNDGQVNALYNGGSGSNAMTALTQST